MTSTCYWAYLPWVAYMCHTEQQARKLVEEAGRGYVQRSVTTHTTEVVARYDASWKVEP